MDNKLPGMKPVDHSQWGNWFGVGPITSDRQPTDKMYLGQIADCLRCSVCERDIEKGEDIMVNTETGDIKCSRCWVHSL